MHNTSRLHSKYRRTGGAQILLFLFLGAALWGHAGQLSQITTATSTSTSRGNTAFVTGAPLAVTSDVWTGNTEFRLVFVSERPDLVLNYDEGTSTSRDLFYKAGSADTAAVSIAGWTVIDIEGQATETAGANGFCAEIRYTGLNDTAAQLHFYNLQDVNNTRTRTRLAEGSTTFAHPNFTEDASFLVFAADDNDNMTAPADNNSLDDIYLQTFLADGTPDSLERISFRTATPQIVVEDNCAWPDVASTDNELLIVFHSKDNRIIADDTNDAGQDIFLWRRSNRTVTVSRVNARIAGHPDEAGYGLQTLGDCSQPAISADGQTIVYRSTDPYITGEDHNSRADIFAYERASGVTQRVSVDWLGHEGNGACEDPEIDASGRFVVFRSNTTDFSLPTPCDLSAGYWQIFLYDRLSGYLECVSVSGADPTVAADADCYAPDISADGRFVTFATAAESLAGSGNLDTQLFVVDRGGDYLNIPPEAEPLRTQCQQNVDGDAQNYCDLPLTGTESDQDSSPTDPANFLYRLSQLPDTQNEGVIRDKDGLALTTDPATGLPQAESAQLPLQFHPALNFNGTVTLQYQVSDTITWSRPQEISVNVGDFRLGVTTLISAVDGNSAAGDDHSPPAAEADFSLSADGTWAAFASDATNLTSAYSNTGGVFLRHLPSQTTFKLHDPMFFAASSSPTLAMDGSAVAYIADFNKICWLPLGTDAPLTASLKTLQHDDDEFANLTVSGDGRVIAFETAGQMLPSDTDGSTDVYLWFPEEPDGDNLELVSVTSGTEPTHALLDCYGSFMSVDGNAVVFKSSDNFADGSFATEKIWIKFRDSGALQLMEIGDTGVASWLSLSQTGRFAAMQAETADTSAVLVVDLLATQPVLQLPDCQHPFISADGRFLYFTSTRQDLLPETFPAPDGSVRQAYRYDFAHDELVPLCWNGTVYGDDDSSLGKLSQTGRFALFASNAENLLSEDNGKSDLFMLDLGDPDNSLPTAQDSEFISEEDMTAEVLLAADDTDHNDLLFEIITPPQNGTLGSIGFSSAKNSVVVPYTPPANWYGTDSITYRCRDAEGWSAAATVSLSVSEVNDLPQWTEKLSTESYTLDEMGELQVDLTPLASDADAANPDAPDSLDFAFDTGDAPAWVTLDADKLLLKPTYEVASYSESPTFKIKLRVTDGRSDAVPMPSGQAITVTVINVDRAPTVNAVEISPATPVTTDALTASLLLEDPDTGDEVTPEYQWYRDGVAITELTTASLDPSHTAKGESWVLQVRARSNDLYSDWTASGDVVIGNSLPEIQNITDDLVENEILTIDLSQFATDADNDDLQYSSDPAAHGQVTISGSTLTYHSSWDALKQDALATDSWSWSVSDGSETPVQAEIAVETTGINDLPTLTVRQNPGIAPDATTVALTWGSSPYDTFSITDPDSDPSTLVMTATILPVKGQLTDNTGETVGQNTVLTPDRFPLIYERTPDTHGTDALTVTLEDEYSSTEDALLVYLLDNMSVQLQQGWNVIALPLTPWTSKDPSLFFYDTSSESTYYTGKVWHWDTDIADYVEAETLAAGIGFWLYCPEAPTEALVMPGVAPEDCAHAVTSGWNLIGIKGLTLSASLPAEVSNIANIWRWQDSKYRRIMDGHFESGYGYWFYSPSTQEFEFVPDSGD